jgi:threonine aldolase
MLGRLRAAGVLANVVAGRIRLVTHRDVTADQVEEAIGIWRTVVAETGGVSA